MANQQTMFDLRRIPVVKVLIPFAAGALPGSLLIFSISLVWVAIPALFAWICLVILFLKLHRKSGPLLWLFDLWVFLLCLTLGLGSGLAGRPVDPGLPVGDWVIIRGVVKESPKATRSHLRCEMRLQVLYLPDTLYLCETLLQVYLAPGDSSLSPRAGETWQWPGKLSPIRNSGNPGSPDFESIMHRKKCWYRFYGAGPGDPVYPGRNLGTSLRWYDSDFIRQNLSHRWQGGEEELALLKAVCLGDRSSLTEDMRQNYGAAGGMHLLAVSGLHVGLIWWVLQRATRWMIRKSRTEIYRTMAVLFLLWFYASITGFSASVCRAVTMFSFFSLGQMLGQRTHVLNGIFVSALILVAIQPSRLLEPGFQLSYAAMLGIVSFYPKFRRLFRLKNKILKWLWEAAAVSLAAQLLTAPLVIFYFHQLPLYSLLTSIVAIPMLSLLITLFACSVPFLAAGVLEKAFSFMLTALARLMNLSMGAVAGLPGALLEDLQLSFGMLILLLFLLILCMLALQGRSKLPGYLLPLVLSLTLLWSSWMHVSRRGTSELVLCHFRGASMVIFREGKRVDHYCWYRDSSSIDYMQMYRADAWSRRIYQNHMYEVGDSVHIGGSVSACLELARGIWSVGNDHNKCWVITGSEMGTHMEECLFDSVRTGWNPPDILLLSGEPKGLKLSGMQGGSVTEVVMDGSNRSWYRERMHSTQVRMHDTDRQGAYVKRW